MWLKAQNEMEGLLPHAAMGPVERMVRQHFLGLCKQLPLIAPLLLTRYSRVVAIHFHARTV